MQPVKRAYSPLIIHLAGLVTAVRSRSPYGTFCYGISQTAVMHLPNIGMDEALVVLALLYQVMTGGLHSSSFCLCDWLQFVPQKSIAGLADRTQCACCSLFAASYFVLSVAMATTAWLPPFAMPPAPEELRLTLNPRPLNYCVASTIYCTPCSSR